MRKENGIYHKSFYCDDFISCSDGDRIFDIFLLSDIQYCSNERGIKWLNVKLKDKRGEMRAKIWSEKIMMEYEGYKNRIVYISGNVTFYGGKPEFIIEKMKLAPENEIVVTEIIKMLSPEKIQSYGNLILCLKNKIQSEEIRTFVEYLINEETLRKMAKLPVSLSGHLAYKGALLEHTCEVATAAYYYAKSTEGIRAEKYDIDMIIAGAMLHEYDRLSYFKADGYGYLVGPEKKLFGRRYLLLSMLNCAYEKCFHKPEEKISETTLAMLMHIIDATHKDIEPVTMEAMVVKRMDMLSAELEMFESSYISREKYDAKLDFLWSTELKREICTIRREQLNDK